jgi:predicted SAM-dependent methyltransferase
MSATFADLVATHGRRIHLGCGDDRLPGYVNADIRVTGAADLSLDLTELADLPEGAVECLYSNAFFEHLMRPQRVVHLRGAHRALAAEDGFLCYIGIPYFKGVARSYLDGAPGIVGPTFDLFNVYRYTHGDPEHVDGWYFEQLHKSLFDEDEVDGLLADAGFGSYVVFAYAYPGDAADAVVTMGFYASRRALGEAELQAECDRFLAGWDGRRLRAETVRTLLVRAEGRLVRRAPDTPHAAGIAAAERGDLDGAERHLCGAADVTLLSDLAVVRHARGDVDGARRLLDACLVLDPAHADALANRAALEAAG